MTEKTTAAMLGKAGLWTMQLDFQPAARTREVVGELESLGYRSLWFPEAIGKESLTSAAVLLGATREMTVATGITNIWGRDPVTAANAHRTLTEAYPGRFALGLGVSHPMIVEQVRGHRFQRPATAMERYLDAMDEAPYQGPEPATKPVRILAALGPRMLTLASKRADGALTYLVTPEHTASARELLGDSLLAVEVAVAPTTDRDKAREMARAYLDFYLPLPGYQANWKRLGFDEKDFSDGGSDRLVDAMVPFGGPEAIADQVRAHQRAGADHVCVQVLDADPAGLPLDTWRQLAPALKAVS